MSDQRIQYNEEMVGANHPMKSDTLNRLKLVDHDSSGIHRSAAYPSFLVHLNGTNWSYTTASEYKVIPFGASSNKIKFDTASGFDSSGYYTIPKTGKWFISVNVFSCNISTLNTNSVCFLNSGTGFSGISYFDNSYNTSTLARSMAGKTIISLTAGQKISIAVYVGSAFTVSGSSLQTWWSGAYLGQ